LARGYALRTLSGIGICTPLSGIGLYTPLSVIRICTPLSGIGTCTPLSGICTPLVQDCYSPLVLARISKVAMGTSSRVKQNRTQKAADDSLQRIVSTNNRKRTKVIGKQEIESD
jgi:hypothetical protein